MKFIKALAVAGLLTLGMLPASARIVLESRGGRIVDFIKDYSDLRDSGERLIIAGRCVSACTFFLGILPKSQYCVTPEANLGFHSPFQIGPNGRAIHSPEMTKLTFDLYPSNVRRVLRRMGWNGDNEEAHPDIIWVSGRQLRAIAPPCDAR